MTIHQISLPGLDGEPKVVAEIETMSEDFDWFNDDSIIVEEQPALAVYRNKRNHVVIRSRRECDDEDAVVFIGTPENLKLLIASLQRELRDWR